MTDSSKPDIEGAGSPDTDTPGEQSGASSGKSTGPTFNDAPDPLSGVSKWAADTWRSTEGRTVSMRVYIGTIVGVIVLMMLARCGG